MVASRTAGSKVFHSGSHRPCAKFLFCLLKQLVKATSFDILLKLRVLNLRLKFFKPSG